MTKIIKHKNDMIFALEINHYLNNFNVSHINYEVKTEFWNCEVFYKEKDIIVKKPKIFFQAKKS